MPERRQHRRRRIRRSVGAASLATFAIAWGVIAGTGAMGHSSSTAPAAATQSAQPSDDDGQSAAAQQLPDMTTQQS